MKDDQYSILSIDAGGIKGIYSATIIKGLCDRDADFASQFTHYVGTSIGALIAASMCYGVSPEDTLKGFQGLKNDLHKGHSFLLNQLFKWSDYIFGNEKMSALKGKLFVPVYNSSDKSLSYFSNETDDANLSISDVIKAACSDIRIVHPFHITSKDKLYSDAGFFAYDPTIFFLRSRDITLNQNLEILSIGSGIIENISEDLSLGADFDIVYDTFLYEQFLNTAFFFEKIAKEYKVKYKRISEFSVHAHRKYAISEIVDLAEKRLNF